MRLARRSETVEIEQLLESFVDVGSLFPRLTSRDHQIVYGRRGTGKTHALNYLAASQREEGETAIYIDLQSIGSSGGIYGDLDAAISEAGTKLVVDTISAIHEQILNAVLAAGENHECEERTLLLLERLGDDITQVRIVGEEERFAGQRRHFSERSRFDIAGVINPAGPTLRASAGMGSETQAGLESHVLLRGTAQHRVHFGRVSQTMRELVATLPRRRLWILLDEWSAVPLHLQPLLADLLRRCLFCVRGITVKIAAIEHRSRFHVDAPNIGHIGIELGADAAADVDLDDFMVFGNDEDRAVNFFGQLFHHHMRAMALADGLEPPHPTPAAFVADAFASPDVFRELVRAAEGVPRDAINVIRAAASKAEEARITMRDVREAARAWYGRDKSKAVESKPVARELLHWIIDRVIDDKRARGFLLEQGKDHPLIDFLYDARVLHVLKRGISGRGRAGVRFDAYGLDYGCYVELLTTKRAPQGLLAAGEGFVEVPPDDYNALGNAILDLSEFADRVLPIRVRERPIRWLVRDMDITDVGDSLDEPGTYLVTNDQSHFAAIRLEGMGLRIGRHGDAEIQIRDPSVEDQHAVISDDGDGAVLFSGRQSRVYVNQRRISHTQLRHGDRVDVGRFAFHVIVVAPRTVAGGAGAAA